MRIAIVTYVGQPGGTPDDVLLAEALRALGASVAFAPWSDPQVSWADFDGAVVRTTWDYHLNADAWRGWLASVPVRLINDRTTLIWNSDKAYLADLERRGLPVIPTELIERNATVQLGKLARTRGWTDIVVKPSVGASSHGARRFAAGDPTAQAHLDRLLDATRALVQPFQAEVETRRERSIIVVDGIVTHGFSKAPFSAGTDIGRLGFQPHAPEPAEIELALAAVGAAPGDVAVARVDMVPCADGLRLMELELIEPHLELARSPAAVTALARRIVRIGASTDTPPVLSI
jgi:glutathione synthase/RimK-type ligase-like ATP-grasp enzyme